MPGDGRVHGLLDIGANLTHESFRGDLPVVLERARMAGVERLVSTGTTLDASQAACALAQKHPGVLWSTAGVHPHDAAQVSPETLPAIRELFESHPQTVVAVGECGLDFARDYSPRPVQEAVFAAHLELAVELGVPMFLHERDAHERFAAMLQEYGVPGKVPVVVHCFTGDEAALDRYLEMDCHVGITGWICDERRGAHLLDLVGRIPENRLMLETDAPFLIPRTMPKPPTPPSKNATGEVGAPRKQRRGRRSRNEPAFLPWVLHQVALARGEDPARLAASTSRTAAEFFRLSGEVSDR